MSAPRAWLEELSSSLGEQGLWTEPSDLAAFESGWRYGQGRALAVARPTTTEEVCAVLARCHAHGVRVQPAGGGTGLVGATNPDASGEQLVLSLGRLNKRIEVDALNRSVRVDGGVLLSQLNAALEPHGLCFPIDLGADPQVGGMVATNTGGTRLLKYGDVRANLLGLEVVLSDGTRIEQLDGLRKNNTGLDLKQLFTGTSGVFGVVTGAILQLAPLPKQRCVMLAAAQDGDGVLALLAHLEQQLGEYLSAYEAISGEALAATLKHGAGLRDPFPGQPLGYAVLVELSSTLLPEQLNLEELLGQAIMEHMESPAGEGILDVAVGSAEDFWSIRHQISESLREEGRLLAFDLSVPRSQLAHFTEAVAQRLAQAYPFVRLCDFGHWGDGGTHLNLVWPDQATPLEPSALVAELQELIYDLCVQEYGGSFSAEHGVGPHNQRFYERYTPSVTRELCARLKAHLDPKGLLGTTRL